MLRSKGAAYLALFQIHLLRRTSSAPPVHLVRIPLSLVMHSLGEQINRLLGSISVLVKRRTTAHQAEFLALGKPVRRIPSLQLPHQLQVHSQVSPHLASCQNSRRVDKVRVVALGRSPSVMQA